MSKIVEKSIINISLPIEVLWLIFAVVLIFFIVMAAIFIHHWRYYGIKNNPKVFAKTLYFVVSTILVVVMLFAIVYYESDKFCCSI